jgi:hypothetical protein
MLKFNIQRINLVNKILLLSIELHLELILTAKFIWNIDTKFP